jgi:hypothetical protein
VGIDYHKKSWKVTILGESYEQDNERGSRSGSFGFLFKEKVSRGELSTGKIKNVTKVQDIGQLEIRLLDKYCQTSYYFFIKCISFNSLN